VLKVLYRFLYGTSAAALALLCVDIGLQARARSAVAGWPCRADGPAARRTRQRGLRRNQLLVSLAIPIFNTALAGALMLLTALPLAYLLYRIAKMRRQGLVWSARRRANAQLRVAISGLTLLLQLCFLLPNALLIKDVCDFAERYSAVLIFVLLEWLCWGALLTCFLIDIHWRLPRTPARTTLVERITLPPLRPPAPTRPDGAFIDLGWDWRILLPKARAGVACSSA
jgi:hypothetical protein